MSTTNSVQTLCYYICLAAVTAMLLAEGIHGADVVEKSRKKLRRHRKASAATAASEVSVADPSPAAPETANAASATAHRSSEKSRRKGRFNTKLNPLLDQPNLSVKKTSGKDEVLIYGSRKAFTITRMQYLKKEWCKTEMLRQVIRVEGCLRRTILNRFCYGQCNSFFIPKSGKKDIESGAFKSCAFCKPKRYSYITVTLNCPGKRPRYKRKRIQRIKQCKCMAQKLD